MTTPSPNAERHFLHESPDFSLVLGGPLYQLWRRTRLTGGTLQLLSRRLVVTLLLTWLPLLILSMAEGSAWGGAGREVAIPFLLDIETHLRFLVAVPLLIVAELVVHQRMRPLVQQFIDRGLITEETCPRFDAAIWSAMRLRNSVAAELLLIAIVYVVGVGIIWRTQVALSLTSWYGVGVDNVLRPTLAGWWMGLVSLPIFQFLLLRWCFRLFIWTRFLWQVSRLKLSLVHTHPDRCGGLGFLSSICYAFSPILMAQGTLLAGLIANRIFFNGATLPEFKVEIAALVALMVFLVLVPLLIFAPQLEATKRAAILAYGTFAQRYAREFDEKWIRGGAPAGEPLLGSADIQSMADLINTFEVVKGMRLAPVTFRAALKLAITTALPLLPLTLTMISLDQLLDQMLKLLF